MTRARWRERRSVIGCELFTRSVPRAGRSRRALLYFSRRLSREGAATRQGFKPQAARGRRRRGQKLRAMFRARLTGQVGVDSHGGRQYKKAYCRHQ
jgi:hypothetical protein